MHFLVENVYEFSTLNLKAVPQILAVPRGREFSDFFEGCLVFHCFARLLQAAKFFRGEFLDEPLKASQRLTDFIVDKLGITHFSCRRFTDLTPLAMEAADRSSPASATPSRSEKDRTIRAAGGNLNCYSCGKLLDLSTPKYIPAVDAEGKYYQENGVIKKIFNPDFLDFEHIWPHSMGGNSRAENLLPSCIRCNQEKKNMVSWEWALLHALVKSNPFGVGVIAPEATDLNSRISLHMKSIITYAKENGASLKESALMVGPRIHGAVLLDAHDSADYFNLSVNDRTRIAPLEPT